MPFAGRALIAVAIGAAGLSGPAGARAQEIGRYAEEILKEAAQ
ncbi:hypothetical protein ACFPL7_13315 [Dongia soli]|uniref:Uncharacterized protein n=1 Tax=Dongia soli TaxID=600628 RepID=A0ABU5EFS1_9PROT|nr:hypothetical protein [Dongia soli]MDY0884955.1 hypothetical protein [Dongia soli]